MHKFVIFVVEEDRWEGDRIAKEAKILGCQAIVKDYRQINIRVEKDQDKPKSIVENADVAIFRSSRDILRGKSYLPLANTLRWELNNKGTYVMNSEAMKFVCFDKLFQQQMFKRADLPYLKSYVCASLEEVSRLIEKYGSLVVKPLTGSSGSGVRIISSTEEGDESSLNEIVFQEVASEGVDYRVMVVGNDALGVMERRAREGEFVTNFSRGGNVSAVKLTENDMQLAINACKLFGLEYAGVDLIKDKNGRMRILEVNRFAQFRGFEKATHINVAKKIVEYCLSRI